MFNAMQLTWNHGGHSGDRCEVLLDVMYAVLELPAAGLLLVCGLGRVGVFAVCETGGRGVAEGLRGRGVCWAFRDRWSGQTDRLGEGDGMGWVTFRPSFSLAWFVLGRLR